MIVIAGKRCSDPAPPQMMDSPPLRITVTGAAGRVAYALLFRIASGGLFGPGQSIQLVLFDLPRAKKAVQGVAMELEDCSFPLLERVVVTDDPAVAFADKFASDHLSIGPQLMARLAEHFDGAQIQELGIWCAFCTGFGRMGAVFDQGEELPVGQKRDDGERLAPWSLVNAPLVN